MSNISKIFATYNGEEFECVIGQEYEFSDCNDFRLRFMGKLASVNTGGRYNFESEKDAYKLIRPVQKPKELTADELYRCAGSEGYELKTSTGLIGIPTGCVARVVQIGKGKYSPNEITHFRPAYSKEEWKPINQIERE